jgi:hypothetical protein
MLLPEADIIEARRGGDTDAPPTKSKKHPRNPRFIPPVGRQCPTEIAGIKTAWPLLTAVAKSVRFAARNILLCEAHSDS